MNTSVHKPRLSAEQVSHFHNEGYLLFHQPVFPQTEFDALKAIFEEDLEQYGADNLDTMHFRDARLLPFLMSDHVLDLIEPLIGEDIGLWSSHFISKPPFTGKATPWHEDSAYWNGRVSTMEGIVTIWLAIDPASPENGCMRVIPGTHFNGFSEYEKVDRTENIFDSQIKPDAIDENKAVYFALKPNECSIHEARLVHGAQANTSAQRRTGYTMRYFPTTSKILPARNQNHKVWLVRGVDRAGNHYENA